MHHTFEIPMSVFTAFDREGQSAISYTPSTIRSGMGGPHIPPELEAPLVAGDAVTFKTMLPPGTAVASWLTQFDSKSAKFSVNGGPLSSTEPTIYLGPPLTTAQLVDLTLYVDKPQGLMYLSLNWGISEPALYGAWVAAGRPLPQPPAPESHEQRTLRLIEQAGLIPPLMLLAKETDHGVFVQQAIESGTWAGMLKLVEMAKQEAR